MCETVVKIDKFDYIKIKIYCLPKDTINKRKRQTAYEKT